MNGKILKLANNDLYGNALDRTVSVFVAFTHKKYMNHYVIFTYTDMLDKKQLYYGSVHLKPDSLVVFQVNDNVLPIVNEFISEYLNDKIDANEYEIIDIKDINKLEFVSASVTDYDNLKALDDKSIKKEATVEGAANKSHTGLYLFIVVIMLLLGGVTYLYFNPSLLQTELKELKCESNLYHSELEMKYLREIEIKFNKADEPVKYAVTETYKFSDMTTYFEFKDNDRQNEYFNTIGSYKYTDALNQLKIFYDEETVIDNYQELYKYLKNEGYTCQEGTYYE